jgi:hypothetical protein
MTELKQAMEALKESASADARFKSALKHNPAGDAGKLQTALNAYVLTVDLLEKALAADSVKDKVKAALQPKIGTVRGRFEELCAGPLFASLGVAVLPVEEACAAVAAAKAAALAPVSAAPAPRLNPVPARQANDLATAKSATSKAEPALRQSAVVALAANRFKNCKGE